MKNQLNVESDSRQFLWTTKYRPQRVADTILPEAMKKAFQSFVDSGNIPNLLLSGNSGVGKTTIAKAMCNELGVDFLMINGSLNGTIDTLRTDIMQFASTVSFNEGRKIVILDEADHLSAAVQAALRGFIEEFAISCGFILTCNFKNKITPALQSRCAVIDFVIPTEEKTKLAKEFMLRIQNILDQEGVEYDPATIARLISNHFPDWRRIIGELQRYSRTGAINTGILSVGADEKEFTALLAMLKNKKWNDMRRWVGQHMDIDPVTLMRQFYDSANAHVAPSSIPNLVLLIADAQYKISLSADSEIAVVAFMTQVMSEVTFK